MRPCTMKTWWILCHWFQRVKEQLNTLVVSKNLQSITIKSLPYLPMPLLPLTSPDGSCSRVTLRALQNNEISLFYEAARCAVDDETCTGSYGADELHDLTHFAFGWVFVVELNPNMFWIILVTFVLNGGGGGGQAFIDAIENTARYNLKSEFQDCITGPNTGGATW